MLTQSEDEKSGPAFTQGEYSSDINNDQNYSSSYNPAELDERYNDTQNTELIAPHGLSGDTYGWRAPSTSLPWWDEAIAPVPPPAVAVSSSSAGSGPQRRTIGSTRGNDQSSSGIHSSTTITTTTTTITAPPPPAAAAAPDSGTTTDRSRTTGNKSIAPVPATRKTGSNRGDGRD